MNKIILIILSVIILILFLTFQDTVKAQIIDSTEAKIMMEKMRLPLPPSKGKKAEYYSLEDEVAFKLIEAIEQLRLYDVFVGIYYDSTIEISDSAFTDDMVVDIKQVRAGGFIEAIVLTTTNMYQIGVLPGEKEDYFSIKPSFRDIFEKDSEVSEEAYVKNIQTQLFVQAQLLDLDTGNLITTLEIEAIQTGGSREKSKVKVLKQFKNKLIYELKWLYWLASEVMLKENRKLIVPIGTELGVEKGMIFELIEPDRIMIEDEVEMLIPGGRVAFATVADTANEKSSLEILRQWQDDYPGSWVVERLRPIHALQLNFIPPSTDSHTTFGIQFHARPLKLFDWGLGARFVKITDSDDNNDYGFGFGGFIICRFLNMAKLDVGGQLGLDLDIPFREDDEGRIVHTALFSAYTGITAEFLLSAKSDLFISVGYRIGGETNNWEYSEDDETYSAYWKDKAPEVDNTGFMLSVGIKFLLF
ncbi:MAG: hypothetical protein JSW07_14505 [bacterium]|nr:MAG: hypothetical protein JSW07_14505 [bacterium]